jgi:transcription elongation factor Elf1
MTFQILKIRKGGREKSKSLNRNPDCPTCHNEVLFSTYARRRMTFDRINGIYYCGACDKFFNLTEMEVDHSFSNETGGANSRQSMNSPTPPINEKGGKK